MNTMLYKLLGVTFALILGCVAMTALTETGVLANPIPAKTNSMHECHAVGSSACGGYNKDNRGNCACDQRSVTYNCDDGTAPYENCDYDKYCHDTNCPK